MSISGNYKCSGLQSGASSLSILCLHHTLLAGYIREYPLGHHLMIEDKERVTMVDERLVPSLLSFTKESCTQTSHGRVVGESNLGI